MAHHRTIGKVEHWSCNSIIV
ncbi:Protein of unknown function [Pyronema omphalodes CBS 100304]|uniref:Uncharacterized protein n=1 Tax=Pyronema omphalodes (strain CBS 100304) TaxID=1076935 RepID=U4LBD9_PYROM|nr:Protein of unknown function [Pyronema omphalodes CBS 100304]